MTGRAEEILKFTGTPYTRGVDLARYSTFGIHSVAALLAAPTDAGMLVSLLTHFDKEGIRYRVVGGMSNTMPSSDSFDGVVVVTRKLSRKTVAENGITAECGASLSSIVRALSACALGGLEPFFHIPGTLGGAVYGNAGAHGKEISDVLLSGVCYSRDTREVLSVSGAEMGFAYRASRLKNDGLILVSATLAAHTRLPQEIDAEIERCRTLRRNQPHGVKTLGSTFKRVNGVSAGYYIDKAGLKGVSVGDAAVSEVHAGFIINRGSARPCDVLELIRLVKARVYSVFGIALEEEICLL